MSEQLWSDDKIVENIKARESTIRTPYGMGLVIVGSVFSLMQLMRNDYEAALARQPQPMPERRDGEALREALAEYSHNAWAGWMKYMFSKGEVRQISIDGETELKWIMPAWAFHRWQRQMNTSYAELPGEEKESDRLEADRMIETFDRCPPEATSQPMAVEVQPPQHVREYVETVLEGEYTSDELRFVLYNDTQAHDWLDATPQPAPAAPDTVFRIPPLSEEIVTLKVENHGQGKPSGVLPAPSAWHDDPDLRTRVKQKVEEWPAPAVSKDAPDGEGEYWFDGIAIGEPLFAVLDKPVRGSAVVVMPPDVALVAYIGGHVYRVNNHLQGKWYPRDKAPWDKEAGDG